MSSSSEETDLLEVAYKLGPALAAGCTIVIKPSELAPLSTLRLVELVHEIFALEAVVIFDADLHEIYQAGLWNVDPQELAQNVYYFETSDDDAETGIARRVLRLAVQRAWRPAIWRYGAYCLRSSTSTPFERRVSFTSKFGRRL